ncbi:tetratricopeptide repeat protein [Formosa haliotis]|uniref:tetratricopeptide repeat protein n=1 Tax=Formosa haliotis TaxID=1555194 RepID=UPI00082653B4|nr:tetratricopeptide repeat protein [Formosa haliotis]
MHSQFYKHTVLYIYFCFLAFSTITTAQNIDSLKQVYNNLTKDTDKVNILHKIGDYYNAKNLDSSLFFHKEALVYAEKSDSDSLIAKSNSNLAIVYLMKGKLDISMSHVLQSLKFYETQDDVKGIVKSLNNIALIHFYQSKFEDALLNYNKSFEMVDKSAELSTKQKANYKGQILNNIGIIYDNQENLNKALEYYTKASTFSKTAEDSKTVASINSNIGLIYLKMDKYDLAEGYFNESLDLRISEKDNFGQCKSYQHLGNLYKAKGDLTTSEKYLELGLQKCSEANASRARAQILSILSETNALQNNYQKAYNYHVSFSTLQDSLSNSEVHRKITEAEMQFKFDKEVQEKEAQIQKRQFIYIIIAIVLVLGCLIFITLYFLSKTKAKNQKLLTEKVDLENKELSLRKLNLEQELETRSKDLTTNVMYLIKKNELISEISLRLIALKRDMKKENQKDIQKIIMDLQTAKDDAIWDEFEVRFNQVYNEFYERLNERFPNLTSNEKKICAFLKLNLTSKEICTLTRQSTNSLNVARTRLRKKLGLNNTQVNLTTFLENI